MFEGTVIDQLIKAVERAEQHAREQQQKRAAEMNLQRFSLPVVNWRQVNEVA